MPVSEKLKSPFEPECYYHLVFKSISGLFLFRETQDYSVFRYKFLQFTSMIFNSWAFCQLGNHTHHIIKVKPFGEVIDSINKTAQIKRTVTMRKLLDHQDNMQLFDTMMERQVNSFMVSFSNYHKIRYEQHGGIFQSPFKRIKIVNESWLQQAIVYVHANIMKHKISDSYKNYLHSSFNAILNNETQFCAVSEVLDFFDGKNRFIQIHDDQVKYYYQTGFPDSKLE